MKDSHRFVPRFFLFFSVALFAASASALRAQAPAETVSLILIDGDIREDWPDPGVVGFHRKGTTGPLTVSFTIGGTATRGIDYTVPAGDTITIPDGDQEVWLQFQPANIPLSPAKKTITVTLQSSAAYTFDTTKNAHVKTLALSTVSPQPSTKAAVRFLLQAAFGPDGGFKNVQDVVKRGYDGWITAQFAKPVGLHQPYLSYLNRVKKGDVYADAKNIAWWNRVMGVSSSYPGGPVRAADPLRQRVGFALSEIFVISDRPDDLSNQPIGMSNYYDMLLKGAFGNYRDLLYNVGTHPCMGVYLSHLQNEKGDPEAGTFADENFAREIMQLFSIGLWELNPDGTRKVDDQNQNIPTYDNTTIANMARVMTGFSFGGKKADDFWYPPENYTTPMRMWDEYHDVGPKTIIGGIHLPARTPSDPDIGTAGLADYAAAVDALFNHPNTGPFFCRQLIQKLITSNPSPEYVGRVAAKFANNGSGVRGDLKAVIRAILLDPEARDPQKLTSSTFGKMKEPYLRTVNLVRAFNARAANGNYALNYLGDLHFQQPQSAPSVFNFYKPGFAPAGPINDAGLVGPEFQILNAVTALSVPNYHLNALRYGFNRWGSENPRALVRGNFRQELALVNDVPALLRRLDLLLTGGTLPNEQHEIIREAVERIDDSMWEWKQERIWMAIYLIAAAPEYGILR